MPAEAFQTALAAMAFMADLQGADLPKLSWNLFWMFGKYFQPALVGTQTSSHGEGEGLI